MSAMGDRGLDKRERSRRIKQRSSGTADWQSVDGELLKSAIAAASRAGGALRFGYSRDGGAYAIGVYGDGDPYTLWVKPGDPAELDITLQDILEGFEGEPPEPAGKPKKRA